MDQMQDILKGEGYLIHEDVIQAVMDRHTADYDAHIAANPPPVKFEELSFPAVKTYTCS
jgi:hypothetical protein